MTALYGASPSLTVEPAGDGGLIVTGGGEIHHSAMAKSSGTCSRLGACPALDSS